MGGFDLVRRVLWVGGVWGWQVKRLGGFSRCRVY